MKTFRSIFRFIFFLIIVWGVLSAAKPFWDRYWLQEQMKTAAIYGTKNSVDDTREFLNEKMEKEGYDFAGQDFIIRKAENNDISICLKYIDEIRVFGVSLRQLEFEIETSAREVEGIF